jgi:hypothetical protein
MTTPNDPSWMTGQQTQHASWSDPKIQAQLRSVPTPTPASGQYFFPLSAHTSSTSNNLTNLALRLSPWVVDTTTSISRVAADVTAVGDVGSKLRMGIYADNGFGVPGSLVSEFGTIPTDAVAVAEVVLGSTLTIKPGVYWIGGAVQLATTTQPTIRTVASGPPPFPLGYSATLPGAGVFTIGWVQTAISAALPATVGVVAASAATPRLIFKAA